MSNFFRKISKPLVVLVLVLAVFTGYVSASEGDPLPALPDVAPASPSDSAPDAPAPSEDPVPDDAPDASPDTSEAPAGDDAPLDAPAFGGDTFTASGTDVTIHVEEHSTLSVASVPSDPPDAPAPHAVGDPETPTLAETIRALFGPYTPRTQTVTTYYDGQPISTEEQIVPGLAGLDFEWLSGVGMFALITFCLFRLLGGVLKNG